MSQDPREIWRQLQTQLKRQGGGGFGGGPRNAIGGALGLALLGGTVVAFNNALFNGMPRELSSIVLMTIVDGGHRAIKYTRVGGVQKEIFNEGSLPGTLEIEY